MKIELKISRCRHCKHWEVIDKIGDFLDDPICLITKEEKNDFETCDNFQISRTVKKELKETLGFLSTEIKYIK